MGGAECRRRRWLRGGLRLGSLLYATALVALVLALSIARRPPRLLSDDDAVRIAADYLRTCHPDLDGDDFNLYVSRLVPGRCQVTASDLYRRWNVFTIVIDYDVDQKTYSAALKRDYVVVAVLLAERALDFSFLWRYRALMP
jgi:hypothetical protein